MQRYWVQVIVLSTYFDYDEYDNPLKTYVDDQDVFSINDDFATYADLKVQQNKAYLADSLFFNYNFEEETYYNVKNRNHKTVNSALIQNSLLGIFISLDKESEEYERVVYTFLDMFGFLGGLFDFMFFCGFILTQYCTEKSYLNSVFSKLYQVKVEENREDQFIKSMMKHQNTNEDLKQNNNTYLNNDESQSKITFKINTTSLNSSYEAIDDNYIKNLREEFKNRRRYSFNIYDNIKSMFKL